MKNKIVKEFREKFTKVFSACYFKEDFIASDKEKLKIIREEMDFWLTKKVKK